MPVYQRIIYISHEIPETVKSLTVAKRANSGHGEGHYVNGFDLSDTVVQELVHKSDVISLRLIQLNQRYTEAEFFQKYSTIVKLEAGCPLSVPWLFQYLYCMPCLKILRIGKQAFNLNNGGLENGVAGVGMKGNLITSVQRYEVQYDVEAYQKLDDRERRRVNLKIGEALILGKACLRNLTACVLIVPKNLENILDDFIKEFPALKSTSEKRIRYNDNTITFVADASKAQMKPNGHSAGPSINKGGAGPPRKRPSSTVSDPPVEVITLDDDGLGYQSPTNNFVEPQPLRDPRRQPAVAPLPPEFDTFIKVSQEMQ